MATGDATPERWLPVPEYEGLYEVSDLGRVRSLTRTATFRDGRKRRVNGCLMRPAHGPAGKYLMVTLSKDGIYKRTYVHVLVLLAFAGPRPLKNEARHGPNGRYDNSLANLCWGTMSENHQDRRRDGDPGRSRPKLTVEAVRECKQRRVDGEKLGNLAKEFGVAISTLSQAVNGVTWADV